MSARRITPDMTLLDIVHAHPATEAVFRSRDAAAGVCLLCTALFDSVADVASRHGIDMEGLLAELEMASHDASDTNACPQDPAAPSVQPPLLGNAVHEPVDKS